MLPSETLIINTLFDKNLQTLTIDVIKQEI